MAAGIYIIEDHEFMRQALADFIEDIPDLWVQGAVETAEEALEGLDGSAVELVLVDTRLPGMDGIELVSELLQRWPGLRCLMLSGHEERTYVQQAMDVGARGYVVKGNPDEIPEAIQRVLDGDFYFSEALQDKRASKH